MISAHIAPTSMFLAEFAICSPIKDVMPVQIVDCSADYASPLI